MEEKKNKKNKKGLIISILVSLFGLVMLLTTLFIYFIPLANAEPSSYTMDDVLIVMYHMLCAIPITVVGLAFVQENLRKK